MRKRLFALTAACLLLLSACAGTGGSPASPTPSPSQSVSPVFTDWTKLKNGYEENLYTRRYQDYTERLIPADDYGTLVPFVGATVAAASGVDAEGDYTDYRYGLMTTKGEIVVDPVFSGAYDLSWYDSGTGDTVDMGAMVLSVNVVNTAPADGQDAVVPRYGLCARDGSWCTDLKYSLITAASGELIAAVDPAGSIDVYDVHGTLLRSMPLSQSIASLSYLWEVMGLWGNGLCAFSAPDTGRWTILDVNKGISYDAPEGVVTVNSWQVGDGLLPASDGELYGYLDSTGKWVIQPQYQDANGFSDGRAIVKLQDGSSAVIDESGKILWSGTVEGSLSALPCPDGTYIYTSFDWPNSNDSGPTLTVAMDSDFHPISSLPVGKVCQTCDSGWFLISGDKQSTFYNWKGDTFTLPVKVSYASFQDDLCFAAVGSGDSASPDYTTSTGVYKTDGTCLLEPGTYSTINATTDSVTGESYYIASINIPMAGTDETGLAYSTSYTLMDQNFKPLLRASRGRYPSVIAGLASTGSDLVTEFSDLSGNVVFRYLVSGASED